MDVRIIFRPVCWFQEVYRRFHYDTPDGTFIPGHDYIEQSDGSLECEICGYKSEEKVISDECCSFCEFWEKRNEYGTGYCSKLEALSGSNYYCDFFISKKETKEKVDADRI